MGCPSVTDETGQLDSAASTDESPFVRRRIVPRIVKVMLLVDLVAVLAALAIWFGVRDDGEENVVNDGLRGSKPPSGQRMPDLREARGLEPAAEAPAAYRGTPVVLFATCMDCRSGDVFGGYLGRLGAKDLPDGARAVVVAWNGDVEAWRREWGIDDERLEVHVAPGEQDAAVLRTRLGIGGRAGNEESGIAFLYDPSGRWRATYFLGQLDREDIRHDLEELAG